MASQTVSLVVFFWPMWILHVEGAFSPKSFDELKSAVDDCLGDPPVDDCNTRPKQTSAKLCIPWLMRPAPSAESIPSGQREQKAAALTPLPRDLHYLVPTLIDVHNHMAGYGVASRTKFMRKFVNGDDDETRLWANKYCVMSVEPSDWKTAMPMGAVGRDQWVPCLGIHPMAADEVVPDDDRWFNNLEKSLRALPSAIVGEIGIDRNKNYKHFYDTHQRTVFRRQMELAQQYDRAVSIHCVKACGELVQYFREQAKNGIPVPWRLCFHSFSGSFDTAKDLIRVIEGKYPSPKTKSKISKASKNVNSTPKWPSHPRVHPRVFFSFCAWTNLWKKNIGTLVEGLWRDGEQNRILIESDWSTIDFAQPDTDVRDVDKILLNGIVKIANLLDRPPEEIALLTSANAKVFIFGKTNIGP